eukprot:3262785-Rhodomonas_salina.1
MSKRQCVRALECDDVEREKNYFGILLAVRKSEQKILFLALHHAFLLLHSSKCTTYNEETPYCRAKLYQLIYHWYHPSDDKAVYQGTETLDSLLKTFTGKWESFRVPIILLRKELIDLQQPYPNHLLLIAMMQAMEKVSSWKDFISTVRCMKPKPTLDEFLKEARSEDI